MKIRNLQTKKFYNIGPWGQCYESFYIRKLRIECSSLAIFSCSVQYLWIWPGAYPKWNTLTWISLTHKHLTRLQKACQRQTHQLITDILNNRNDIYMLRLHITPKCLGTFILNLIICKVYTSPPKPSLIKP